MSTRSGALQAVALTKSIGGRTVVSQVSFHVEAGEVVGLFGRNGAGKTTVFRMIMGVVSVDEGRVTWGERDITRVPTHQRARLGLGYLPQEASVFRGLTVEQNLEAVLELRGRAKGEAKGWLERFGLGALRRQRASTLSGGERRRLELARLLAQDPSLLLLDEPFKGLDAQALEGARATVRRRAEEGAGVLLTDHVLEQSLDLCHRVYLLDDGRIVSRGAPAEIEGLSRRRFSGSGAHSEGAQPTLPVLRPG